MRVHRMLVIAALAATVATVVAPGPAGATGSAPAGVTFSCNPPKAATNSGTICTVTVQPPTSASVVPTGGVVFSSSSGAFDTSPCTLVSLGASTGASTCHTGYLPSGTGTSTRKDALVANYLGDDIYRPASAGYSLPVGIKAVPFFALVCDPNQILETDRTTCHAEVYAGSTYNGDPNTDVPSGTVTFTVTAAKGTLTAAKCTLSPFGAGGADCSVQYTAKVPGTPTRSDTIKATYSGDARFLTGPASTTVSVGARPVPRFEIDCARATYDKQAADCELVAHGPNEAAAAPRGVVTFAATTKGRYTPTTCTLQDVGFGVSQCDLLYAPTGTGSATRIDTLTAKYPGDPDYAPTSASTTVQVGVRRVPTVDLSCSPNPTSPGTASVCEVDVIGTGEWNDPSGVTKFTTSGSGHFSTTVCDLQGQSGAATCSVSYTPAGTGSATRNDTITATYAGDSSHAPGKGVTKLAVTSSNN